VRMSSESRTRERWSTDRSSRSCHRCDTRRRVSGEQLRRARRRRCRDCTSGKGWSADCSGWRPAANCRRCARRSSERRCRDRTSERRLRACEGWRRDRAGWRVRPAAGDAGVYSRCRSFDELTSEIGSSAQPVAEMPAARNCREQSGPHGNKSARNRCIAACRTGCALRSCRPSCSGWSGWSGWPSITLKPLRSRCTAWPCSSCRSIRTGCAGVALVSFCARWSGGSGRSGWPSITLNSLRSCRAIITFVALRPLRAGTQRSQ
jgi:hypothetical protein